MKRIDAFLLKDFTKIGKKCEVGFVIDGKPAYERALASVRMRCYDMILKMEESGVKAELYKPYKKYSAVIFTKARTDKAVALARKLYKRGTPVISDAFCEYLTDETRKDDWERNNILQIMACSDCVIAFSKSQYDQFVQYHHNVRIVEESVNDAFFQVQKEHVDKEKITLVYCGYSHNAKDTLVIKDVIRELQDEYHCEILYICEKDPCIKEFPYRYEKYVQKNIPTMLLEGDIMIAPRPMEGIDRLAHTLSKIAHPMAVGIPVVANPVPSYVGTPAILCTNEEEWKTALCKLIEDKEERKRVGKLSRDYIRKNYSQEIICKQYLDILEEIKS